MAGGFAAAVDRGAVQRLAGRALLGALVDLIPGDPQGLLRRRLGRGQGGFAAGAFLGAAGPADRGENLVVGRAVAARALVAAAQSQDTRPSRDLRSRSHRAGRSLAVLSRLSARPGPEFQRRQWARLRA